MQLPKRRKTRLTEYDYQMPGAYFVTICTDKRCNLFWENVGASIARPYDFCRSAADEGIRFEKSRFPLMAKGIL